MVFDPGLGFVADPARLSRKYQSWLTRQRQHNVDVAVHDLKSGDVKRSALKTGILIAAHDQRIQTLALHAGADVLIATVDFLLTWQSVSLAFRFASRLDCWLYDCTPHNSAAVSA